MVTTGTNNNSSSAADNRTRLLPQILTTLNLTAWRGDTKTRYFLSDMLNLENGKMDKKLTIEHVSDAVVWNIVYLTKLCDLPTESPPLYLREQALLWLTEFKKEMMTILKEKIRRHYLQMANSKAWEGVRQNGDFFTTYGDLLEKTKDEKSELVSEHE